MLFGHAYKHVEQCLSSVSEYVYTFDPCLLLPGIIITQYRYISVALLLLLFHLEHLIRQFQCS